MYTQLCIYLFSSCPRDYLVVGESRASKYAPSKAFHECEVSFTA